MEEVKEGVEEVVEGTVTTLREMAVQAGESIARALARGFLNGETSLRDTILNVFKQIIVDIIAMFVKAQLANALLSGAEGEGKSSTQKGGDALATGLTVGRATGNPIAGLIAGAGSLLFGKQQRPESSREDRAGSDMATRGMSATSAPAETTVIIKRESVPVNPIEAANDAEWQQVIAETNRALARGGHRIDLAVT